MSDFEQHNRRILIIDDNPAIHTDFQKVLGRADASRAALEEAEEALFGDSSSNDSPEMGFELESAQQGEQGLELVRRAAQEGRPFAMAFVDMRMPPGWDGLETAARLWEEDPRLQIVFCTAYSDYSWKEMASKLVAQDRWVIIKKPFDNIEVRQMAACMSEKWNLARKLDLQMDELERTVQERTMEICEQRNYLEDALARLQEAHAQLLQADKMSSIGQLAAGVAHEINNPIGFVSSNLNSLSSYIGDLKRVIGAYDELLGACGQNNADIPSRMDQARKAREEIDLDFLMEDIEALIGESIEGVGRVRQIVADLRDFSHVDNPDISQEDVNRLLEKTINVAWNELKYKAEVVRQYGEVPILPCYGGKLGQVFLNLLVNAAQAIPERGTITVGSGSEGELLWVEVTDTGCGIPKDDLSRIFEPFFTTKEVGKGTGMGLNLVYKIVQAHGGKLRVSSEVGQGTTFRIELPLSGPPKVQEEEHELVS